MTDFSKIFSDPDEGMYQDSDLEKALIMQGGTNPFAFAHALAARQRGATQRNEYMNALTSTNMARQKMQQQMMRQEAQQGLWKDLAPRMPLLAAMELADIGGGERRADVLESTGIERVGRMGDAYTKLATGTADLAKVGREPSNIPFDDLGFGQLNVRDVPDTSGGGANGGAEVTENIFTEPGDQARYSVKYKNMTPEQIEQMKAKAAQERAGADRAANSRTNQRGGGGGGRQEPPGMDTTTGTITPGTPTDPRYASPETVTGGNSKPAPAAMEQDGVPLPSTYLQQYPNVKAKIDQVVKALGGQPIPRGLRTNYGDTIVYVNTPQGPQRLVFDFYTGELKQNKQ